MVSLEPKWKFVEGFKDRPSAEAAKSLLEQEGHIARIEHIVRASGEFFNLRKISQFSVSDLFRGLGWRIIAACFPRKVKFAGRLRLLSRFALFLVRVYKTNGPVQVVKYLKASQLALQKALAGDPVESLRVIDPDLVRSRLTSKGLPTIIPSRDRKLILPGLVPNGTGSVPIIRFWLTLFSVYRVIDIPGQLKLGTITQPSTAPETGYKEVVGAFSEFLTSLSVSSIFDNRFLDREGKLLWLESASATQKVS